MPQKEPCAQYVGGLIEWPLANPVAGHPAKTKVADDYFLGAFYFDLLGDHRGGVMVTLEPTWRSPVIFVF